MESAKSRQLDMEQLQQAYPARTMTRTYSLIQRMQDKVMLPFFASVQRV